MSIKGTAIKLALFSFVLLLCTALLIVVFGQLRFQRYKVDYTSYFCQKCHIVVLVRTDN